MNFRGSHGRTVLWGTHHVASRCQMTSTHPPPLLTRSLALRRAKVEIALQSASAEGKRPPLPSAKTRLRWKRRRRRRRGRGREGGREGGKEGATGRGNKGPRGQGQRRTTRGRAIARPRRFPLLVAALLFLSLFLSISSSPPFSAPLFSPKETRSTPVHLAMANNETYARFNGRKGGVGRLVQIRPHCRVNRVVIQFEHTGRD
jgi:hypothetical protein